jgi:trimeric autotransporter adhesin
MFDNQASEFERSISDYKNNANSVAQGALGEMGSLASASRGIAQTGESARASMDTSQISAKMMAAGQKFTKELGIDVNVPLTTGAIGAGLKSLGGGLKGVASESSKLRGFAGEGGKNFGVNDNFFQGKKQFDVVDPKKSVKAGLDPGEEGYSGDVGGDVKTFTPAKPGANPGSEPGPTATEGGYDELGHWVEPEAPLQPAAPAPAAPDPVAPKASTTTASADAAATDAQTTAADAAKQASNAASSAAETAAKTAATTIETSTEDLAATTGEKIASMAGGFLGSVGGFLGDLVPVVGAGLAAYTGYESIKDMKNTYNSEGDDPYAAVRADLASGAAKVQSMSAQISADQFSSKVGGAAPAFGSLAAPTFSTAQQLSGSTGHF